MTIYRPNMLVELDVPYLGTAAERSKQEGSKESITIRLPAREFVIENNSHLHADSCKLVVDWKDTTLDTRMLDDAVVTVYFDEGDDFGRWKPTVDNTVFIGHLRNPERVLEEGSPGTLTLDCIDYTGLFLAAKPFGSSGIPEYSDTLEGAWRRICSQTPGAGVLADNLVAVGTDVSLDTPLGAAVASRFASLSKVPTHPDTDAWAVWLQCVGMLGLISYIDQDVCIVTSATNYYTEKDPPLFIWGENLTRLSESRMTIDVKGGVGLVSFDPLTGKTLEAFYPPIGDPRAQRKLTAAKKKKQKPVTELSQERDKRHIFTMWGVTDPGMLLTIAERVWNQISRQELQGKLETPHIQIPTAKGRLFNLMKLKSGGDIRVQFADGLRDYITGLASDNARIAYLVEQGYPVDTATLLARNAEAFKALGDTFYVDSVRKSFTLDEDGGGDFKVEVTFINKIEVTRGAVGRSDGEEAKVAEEVKTSSEVAAAKVAIGDSWNSAERLQEYWNKR